MTNYLSMQKPYLNEYDTVLKKLIHGPCGSWNDYTKSRPCCKKNGYNYKTGKCNYGYPQEFSDKYHVV